MKTIIVNIEEKVLKGLLNKAELIKFTRGCVEKPNILTEMMIGILKKIKEGKTEVILAKEGDNGKRTVFEVEIMEVNEYIKQILVMYLKGMPVWDICEYVNLGDNEINKIIDKYSPYL